MNRPSALRPACVAACALGVASLAPASAADDLSLSRNRFSLGARFGFNVSAEVRNAVLPPTTRPDYDDGFVREDISHNAGGRTWYWGYTQADQIQGGNLEFHSAASPRDGLQDHFSNDPHAGFELTYGRELRRFEFAQDRELALGLELSFGSLDLNFQRDDTVAGNVTRVAEAYSLAGLTPPLAPYAGTFAGPGPLFPTAPASTATNLVAATSAMSAKLDALVYGFKVGPFLEVPLAKRLTLQVSAGLAAANVEADFAFNETLTVAATGGPPPARVGKYSSSEWLLGFHGHADLAYAFSDTISIFVGGQYQHLGDHTVRGGGKEATLKLGEALEGIVGLRFTF